MTDYGSDFQAVEDLDSRLTLVTGPAVVAQAVARRLQVPRGGLWYAPDYGTDLRAYLLAPVRSRFALVAAIEAEATKDERVQSAKATVAFDGDRAEVTVTLELVDGRTFDLVLDVSRVTVELLTFEAA